MRDFYSLVLQVITVICLILFARWAYVDIQRAIELKRAAEAAIAGSVGGSSVSAESPPSQ